jgi:DNA-nicking Smr family endonuclease
VSEKKSAGPISTEQMSWSATLRGTRRRLSEEEERLWSAVARSVKPLRIGKRVPVAAPAKPPPHGTRPVKKAAPDHPSPAASHHPKPDSKPHPKPRPPLSTIARREKQELARGKAEIGGRIDLHGLTQAEAHNALLHFLRRHQAEGAKFVLVITGKGSIGAVARGERGVLRRQVPLWLGLPEFRACVLGFDVAHVGHGGEGALYVRLRRGRGGA